MYLGQSKYTEICNRNGEASCYGFSWKSRARVFFHFYSVNAGKPKFNIFSLKDVRAEIFWDWFFLKILPLKDDELVIPEM